MTRVIDLRTNLLIDLPFEHVTVNATAAAYGAYNEMTPQATAVDTVVCGMLYASQ